MAKAKRLQLQQQAARQQARSMLLAAVAMVVKAATVKHRRKTVATAHMAVAVARAQPKAHWVEAEMAALQELTVAVAAVEETMDQTLLAEAADQVVILVAQQA